VTQELKSGQLKKMTAGQSGLMPEPVYLTLFLTALNDHENQSTWSFAFGDTTDIYSS
jgi:hypothetical protein